MQQTQGAAASKLNLAMKRKIVTAGQLNTPGPGHYSQPDLNRWFKRSYNMNFSEVWILNFVV